jgi:prefoldin subunit 5
MPGAPELPAVSVRATGSRDATHAIETIQRDLAELRALMNQQKALLELQQQRITQLESRAATTAAAAR